MLVTTYPSLGKARKEKTVPDKTSVTVSVEKLCVCARARVHVYIHKLLSAKDNVILNNN